MWNTQSTFTVLVVMWKGSRTLQNRSSSQFSHSVMSDTLWPHGLQHTRLPCPSPTPKPYSNSMPSSHLILCLPLLLLPSIFPSLRVFSNEPALRMRWPKYWSFSFTITPFKNGSINGQEMPVWWENHFQSGFVSELRDGNHLLFMPMKQQIIVMKDGKHTENCGLF